MFWFIVILVALAIGAYVFRVPLLAKITGQSESRIRQALERRKRN